MSVVEDLSEEECYLLAIMLDQSGVDLAEFLWKDDTTKDGVFRCYDFQYPWYRNHDKFQIDQAARSVGKSLGIQMRAFAFPFHSPGEEMLLTAPEMIHLDPVTERVADRILESRISSEMLKKRGASNGITRRPFEAKFVNGSRVVGRIPQKDGKGVKGCIEGSALVSTPQGLVSAADIKIGDEVLTHRGRYMPVLEVLPEWVECVRVSGAGHRGLIVSDSHRFYGRRNSNPQRTRNLGPPTWLPAYDEELPERWYWASPTRLPFVGFPELPSHVDMRSFLWLCGRWVADGTLMGGNKVKGVSPTLAITVKESAYDDLLATIRLAGYEPRRQKHDNAACLAFYAADLAQFLYEHFGTRAEGKCVPPWLLSASKIARDAFLEGYLSGDGHWNAEKGRWEAGTASKELAVGLKLLGQTLDYTSSFSWVDPKVTHIAHVALKNEPRRSWRVHLKERGRGVFENGVLWQKIRSVEPVGVVKVYDFVVAEDFSYVADGLIHKGTSQVGV